MKMENKKLLEEQLIQLAKKCQVRGFQDKKGIYLAVDRGLDSHLDMGNDNNPEMSREIYTQVCKEGLVSAFGTYEINGILLKIVQLGKLGKEWDARMQVGRDLIAGPFKTEKEAMEIAPYVLRERYGWNPKRLGRINFYLLCL